MLKLKIKRKNALIKIITSSVSLTGLKNASQRNLKIKLKPMPCGFTVIKNVELKNGRRNAFSQKEVFKLLILLRRII